MFHDKVLIKRVSINVPENERVSFFQSRLPEALAIKLKLNCG
jgi:hypothetical protein